MRALIVDDSADFRVLAAQLISIGWPGSQVEEYDPIARGKPAGDFPWAGYDVVLLDYRLGEADGLEWLAEWRRLPGMPPVIFLTASGSEDVAVRAMKLGAADYLRKDDLSRESFAAAVSGVLAGRGGRRAALLDMPTPTAQLQGRSGAAGGIDLIRIGGYRLVRELGVGSHAVVYLTESAATGEPVVLKVLDGRMSHEGDVLERFIREYAMISRISHPNVVRIFDQGFSCDHAFIAMEYLPGGDLKRRIARGMNPGEAMRAFCEIMAALKAIHAAGVIHRDLKPHNILLRTDGRLAVADFGVARDESEPALTAHGQIWGTPAYMSPEQGAGRPIDSRSDIYSAGVVLYEMLTGTRPFVAATSEATIYMHCHDKPPGLPPGLARFQPLVSRLLSKDPRERPQTASEALLAVPP